MQDLIQDELAVVLADWKAGKPVRSIALGHSTRVAPAEGNEPAREVAMVFRQKRAFGYVCALLDAGLTFMKTERKMERPDFENLIRGWSRGEYQGFSDLSISEREAAESLAWKALLRGWSFALAGFDGQRYISVTNDKAWLKEEASR